MNISGQVCMCLCTYLILMHSSSVDSTNMLSKSKETFLKEAHQRMSHDPSSKWHNPWQCNIIFLLGVGSVGVEHRVVACATFSRVSMWVMFVCVVCVCVVRVFDKAIWCAIGPVNTQNGPYTQWLLLHFSQHQVLQLELIGPAVYYTHLLH